jgi:hypothetical protein
MSSAEARVGRNPRGWKRFRAGAEVVYRSRGMVFENIVGSHASTPSAEVGA